MLEGTVWLPLLPCENGESSHLLSEVDGERPDLCLDLQCSDHVLPAPMGWTLKQGHCHNRRCTICSFTWERVGKPCPVDLHIFNSGGKACQLLQAKSITYKADH